MLYLKYTTERTVRSMNSLGSKLPKRYETGIMSWSYRQPCNYKHGTSYNVLLGPCVICGMPTIDYSVGWQCMNITCEKKHNAHKSVLTSLPFWWNTDINVFLDGNAWCATRDGFTNLQECFVGFGNTPQEAVNELLQDEARSKEATE